MSDKKSPGGLNFMAILHGGPPDVQMIEKDASFATPIFSGDAVIQDSNGKLETGPSIIPGETYYTGVSLNYGAANMETHHLIIVSPLALFESADNNSNKDSANTYPGRYSNLDIGEGDEAIRQSGHKVDTSSISDDADRDLLIVGTHSSLYGEENVRIAVTINKQQGRVIAASVKTVTGRPKVFQDQENFANAMKWAIGMLGYACEPTELNIAIAMDKVLHKGEQKYDIRQLRRDCRRYFPGLSWSEIVSIFS